MGKENQRSECEDGVNDNGAKSSAEDSDEMRTEMIPRTYES